MVLGGGGGGASVFVSARTQRRTFGQSGYIADSVATTRVYLAAGLQKPLLLEGPAGSGGQNLREIALALEAGAQGTTMKQ